MWHWARFWAQMTHAECPQRKTTFFTLSIQMPQQNASSISVIFDSRYLSFSIVSWSWGGWEEDDGVPLLWLLDKIAWAALELDFLSPRDLCCPFADVCPLTNCWGPIEEGGTPLRLMSRTNSDRADTSLDTGGRLWWWLEEWMEGWCGAGWGRREEGACDRELIDSSWVDGVKRSSLTGATVSVVDCCCVASSPVEVADDTNVTHNGLNVHVVPDSICTLRSLSR